MNGRVGGRARKGAGELALLVVDERPDVVVGIGIGCDVDARGASGRRRGRRRRRRLRKGASRLGHGLLIGLGLGLRLRLGWRRGALGPALALALVRGETDLEPRYLVVRRLELGLRRRASKGRRVFSAFVVVFVNSRERGVERGAYQELPGFAHGGVVLLPEDRVDDGGLFLGVDGHVRAAPRLVDVRAKLRRRGGWWGGGCSTAVFSNNGREGRGGLPYLPVVARELLVGHDQSLLDRLRGHRDRRSLRLRLPLARKHTTSRRAAAGSRGKTRRGDCSPRAAPSRRASGLRKPGSTRAAGRGRRGA